MKLRKYRGLFLQFFLFIGVSFLSIQAYAQTNTTVNEEGEVTSIVVAEPALKTIVDLSAAAAESKAVVPEEEEKKPATIPNQEGPVGLYFSRLRF